MKRFVLGFILSILSVGAAVIPAHASVNDFTIAAFDADYYLGGDKEGRSTLTTVEHITADFEQVDQNHGIERAIPLKYDNHPTSLRVQSVKDEKGKELQYTTYESNGNEVLRIGNPDTYVFGKKTYVITYAQRDVVKYFQDTSRQEFYWDTNGTGWRQPFGEVTARVHIAPGVLPTLKKDALACYQGTEGATGTCQIAVDGDTVTAHATQLPAGGNMTVALGFTTGTFREYEPSMAERVWGVVTTIWMVAILLTSVAGVVLIFVLSYRYSGLSNRRKDIGTIVPEYIPPKDTSVLVAAQIAENARGELVAQIIDFAVRHYIKLYQTKEKSLLRPAEYELEIIKPIDTLATEEKKFLALLFGDEGTAVGARFAMKKLKNNYQVAMKFQQNQQAIAKSIKGSYKLRQKDEVASRWFKQAGYWALGISIVTLSPVLLAAAITAFVCGYQLRPLTDKGVALRRYLAGLKLYIGVAEKERLEMLQSPEGAEKVGVIGDNTKQLIKLYERVLPYAVLFGQEKEWNKQLGAYYESAGATPDWYVGQSAFNAAVFISALNDFSSTTNSYSAATSSSSGGSGGGGFSGGGGGGGGGGGW